MLCAGGWAGALLTQHLRAGRGDLSQTPHTPLPGLESDSGPLLRLGPLEGEPEGGAAIDRIDVFVRAFRMLEAREFGAVAEAGFVFVWHIKVYFCVNSGQVQ